MVTMQCHLLQMPGKDTAAGEQVWNEERAEEEVLAMVVRTGFHTTLGNMLKQVTAPVHGSDVSKDPFVTVSAHGLCRGSLLYLCTQLPL